MVKTLNYKNLYVHFTKREEKMYSLRETQPNSIKNRKFEHLILRLIVCLYSMVIRQLSDVVFWQSKEIDWYVVIYILLTYFGGIELKCKEIGERCRR